MPTTGTLRRKGLLIATLRAQTELLPALSIVDPMPQGTPILGEKIETSSQTLPSETSGLESLTWRSGKSSGQTSSLSQCWKGDCGIGSGALPFAAAVFSSMKRRSAGAASGHFSLRSPSSSTRSGRWTSSNKRPRADRWDRS